ncbi:hypothetical protein LWI29_035112 [Acer saccharum]|uniref:RING-type E3 ubiquitin transferase n=1 Tax=Acer saccharum TaxID=4024 RepID=A0AA39S4G7_ACESA|nr:hypothetical protein LWI29_025301 [Acer saccharum]KAK0594006.1 hypothetical protein LWI29_035112 [Acer saccharum]KAK1566768.1 hypothetical protein Q3G72_004001 [Acer saccharum]KAK1568852.1 hypothetical protein Q3G72_029733 [Acer saccharum]
MVYTKQFSFSPLDTQNANEQKPHYEIQIIVVVVCFCLLTLAIIYAFCFKKEQASTEQHAAEPVPEPETEMHQVIVQPPPQFVDPVVRERIPKFTLETTSMLPYQEPKCSVCQMEFTPGTLVASLPCNHTYHSDCIDEYMSQAARCPLCAAYIC